MLAAEREPPEQTKSKDSDRREGDEIMILAEKIVNLRKQAGWSQEELAEKLGVSRQAVSKWESAQSIPDLNKVLLLSEVFSVSTDYLLKDDSDVPGEVLTETKTVMDDDGDRLLPVSLEEANAFLELEQALVPRTAAGVFLCIISSVPLILLSGAAEAGKLPVTEDAASALGVVLLLLLVAAGVYIFVTNGIRLEPFDKLRSNSIDTAYGVDGLVREKQEAFRKIRTRGISTGVLLCVVSSIPLLLTSFFSGTEENDFVTSVCAAMLLLLVGCGVFSIIRVSGVWSSFQVLLEEGDYTREKKRRSRSYAGIYWCLATALYLLLSFLTNAWHITWVVWPIAGILWAAFDQLIGLWENRK